MILRKATLLMIGVAALSLGACNKMGATNTGVSGDAPTVTPPTSANQSDPGKKLDTYVEAHNTLVGTFGFEEKAAAYRRSNIAHASINGPFEVDAGWIDQAVKKLISGRALSGGPADLDATVDALIVSMGKVQVHLSSLENYYSSKKYLDDKLARGRAEDPQMLNELDTAQKDFANFSALLDVALDKRDQEMLDELKGTDLLRYNTKLALIHAKKLVDLFNGPEDVKKPEIFAKGDAEVTVIEQAIADAHQEASKRGKSDPSAFGELTSMLGSYRTLKHDHDVDELKSMVRDYNQAVENSNTFGFLG